MELRESQEATIFGFSHLSSSINKLPSRPRAPTMLLPNYCRWWRHKAGRKYHTAMSKFLAGDKLGVMGLKSKLVQTPWGGWQVRSH